MITLHDPDKLNRTGRRRLSSLGRGLHRMALMIIQKEEKNEMIEKETIFLILDDSPMEV